MTLVECVRNYTVGNSRYGKITEEIPDVFLKRSHLRPAMKLQAFG
ncbi:hypothetical protein [Endozoicomonas sp. Mp262]